MYMYVYMYMHMYVDLHMLHGVFKQNEVHDSIDLVVRLQSLFQNLVQWVPGGHSQILGLPNAAGKVAVDERVRVQWTLVHILSEYSVYVITVIPPLSLSQFANG